MFAEMNYAPNSVEQLRMMNAARMAGLGADEPQGDVAKNIAAAGSAVTAAGALYNLIHPPKTPKPPAPPKTTPQPHETPWGTYALVGGAVVAAGVVGVLIFRAVKKKKGKR